MPELPRYLNLDGTTKTDFSVGKTGPLIRNNSDVFEFRAHDGNSLVRLKGASPTDDSDLVTKYYADSLAKPLIVKRGADCTSALPDNTDVKGWVVVQTAGTGAVIGDILYDDGSESGSMAIVPKQEGRVIAVTVALSGGTANFDPDSLYIWDTQGSTWTKIGDVGNITGAGRFIRFSITNSAQQDSTSTIPANAVVVSATLKITTAYSGGATISIGDTSTADSLMLTTDSTPQNTYIFEKTLDVVWTSASVVRVTVAGTPAAGAGVVIVQYTTPNA